MSVFLFELLGLVRMVRGVNLNNFFLNNWKLMSFKDLIFIIYLIDNLINLNGIFFVIIF